MRDIKNNYDDFAEFLADAMEPIARIAADPDVAAVFRDNKPLISLAKPLLGGHRDDMAEVLAALSGDTVAGFKANFNALEMVRSLMSLLSRPEIRSVFQSAGQTEGATSSVSASGITEA